MIFSLFAVFPNSYLLTESTNFQWDLNLVTFCVSSTIGYFQPQEEDRCFHVALHVAAFFEILTKSVITRATTATRAGCVQRGMGHAKPFWGRGRRNTGEDNPQHTPAKHRGAHWKQNLRHWAGSLKEKGFHHHPAGDPLQNCRQANDSKVLTS